MTYSYVAFDLEIAALLPEGETDWKAHRPLGITCAAFAWMDGDKVGTQTEFGQDDNYQPLPRMSQHKCRRMVETLRGFVNNGFTILTHNGVGFDFDILAEESGMHAECVDLALNHHVDTMLHFLAIQGYPIGLDAAAKGMKLSGKPEGMSGALAPHMWADGKFDEVLAYVEQDVITSLELALAVEKRGCLHWRSKRGRPMVCHFAQGWKTVSEALKIPEPDTSWMSSPLRREDLIAWTQPLV